MSFMPSSAKRRASLSDLVAAELWLNAIAVGALQKGDYVVVNHMKVPKMAEWIAFEKKVWQPFAESMAKDGVTRGWFLNGQVMPGGSDLKYQASTVDVYPSWDATSSLTTASRSALRKCIPTWT